MKKGKNKGILLIVILLSVISVQNTTAQQFDSAAVFQQIQQLDTNVVTFDLDSLTINTTEILNDPNASVEISFQQTLINQNDWTVDTINNYLIYRLLLRSTQIDKYKYLYAINAKEGTRLKGVISYIPQGTYLYVFNTNNLTAGNIKLLDKVSSEINNTTYYSSELPSHQLYFVYVVPITEAKNSKIEINHIGKKKLMRFQHH